MLVSYLNQLLEVHSKIIPLGIGCNIVFLFKYYSAIVIQNKHTFLMASNFTVFFLIHLRKQKGWNVNLNIEVPTTRFNFVLTIYFDLYWSSSGLKIKEIKFKNIEFKIPYVQHILSTNVPWKVNRRLNGPFLTGTDLKGR